MDTSRISSEITLSRAAVSKEAVPEETVMKWQGGAQDTEEIILGYACCNSLGNSQALCWGLQKQEKHF